jgi:hypothetical protein
MAILAAFVWSTDSITLQGERTIYTARCDRGAWAEDRCTGKLEAAERYRYRAIKAKNEVVFWVVGSAEPTGRLAPCAIEDGRNWSCQAGGDAYRSITLEMRRGFAVPNAQGDTRAFHAISKARWYLLRYGVVQ